MSFCVYYIPKLFNLKDGRQDLVKGFQKGNPRKVGRQRWSSKVVVKGGRQDICQSLHQDGSERNRQGVLVANILDIFWVISRKGGAYCIFFSFLYRMLLLYLLIVFYK